MEGLYGQQEVTNALSNGTIHDLLRPPLPLDYGSQPPTKTPIAIISGMAKATHFKFSMHIRRLDQNKSLKDFQGTHI